MKPLIVLLFAFAFVSSAKAQKTGDIIKQQAGEGVKEGAKIATQQTADKVTDKVLGKLFSKKQKNKNETAANSDPKNKNTIPSSSTPQGNTTNVTAGDSSPVSITTYSKFDFVPGDKVLVYDDFSKDAIGDFPENWNTNSSGQTVSISGQQGQWLMLNKKGVYKQEDVTSLPDNFTYEFDLIYSGSNPFLQLFFVNSGADKNKLTYDIGNRSGVDIGIQPIPRDKGGLAHIYSYTDGANTIDNQVQFQNNGDTKIKVSVWRQKQRMRVYINQEKVFDLPRAFPAGKTYNTAMFELWSDAENQDKYLISYIKLAAGEPDTRNKLINEGKFSTTGILFDVNSAVIKPQSYGSLKDIATVLQENSTVHVKIIGHTDSDGDATANMTLSKKRAEAVKQALVKDFSIDAARLETDGKGASRPVAPNNTTAGKAQNRRVEFIKL
ncbi:MAG: OmpA family protein [Bacteroidetes bacterium]|nr:OmpA family protein [Bacteroidota bacterium]